MLPNSRKGTLKPQLTQKTTIRRVLIVCSIALLIGGGVFTYLNFGSNKESKAVDLKVNLVDDSEPLTKLSVKSTLQTRSAMNYSANRVNQINVRNPK